MANFVSKYLSEFYNLILTKFQESSYFSNILHGIEEKTGIKDSYIVTGLTTIIILFIGLAFGPAILIDLLVVFYPAYRSFQALEAQNVERLTHWMKYWIVFGMFTCAEDVADYLLWWFPGYLFLKILFLLWCFAPVENNGSVFLYENYIRATFVLNAETMDNVIQSVRSLSSILEPSESSTQPEPSKSSTQPGSSELPVQPEPSESPVQPEPSESSTRPVSSESSMQPEFSASSIRPVSSESSTQPEPSESSMQPKLSELSVQPESAESSVQPKPSESSVQPET